MARKSREEPTGGSWLDTYADMVTLLLTFFVVMLSMSSVDAQKFEALVRSLSQTQNPSQQTLIPSPEEDPYYGEVDIEDIVFDDLYIHLKDYVESKEMESEISISRQDDIVYIRFSSQLFFEPDRYTLKPGGEELLNFIGNTFGLYQSKIKTVNICGHTASTERTNSVVKDFRLSGERAATVAVYFEEVSGFPKEKMITFGYGDSYPVADNATEEGRMQNRRVELVVVGIESNLSFDVYGLLGGTFDNATFPASGGAGDLLMPGPGLIGNGIGETN